MNKQTIAKTIKQIRKEKKLTQEQLYRRIYPNSPAKNGRAVISRYESGTRDLTVTTFFKVCKALQVTIYEFENYEFERKKQEVYRGKMWK